MGTRRDTTLFSPAWRSDALTRAMRRELAPAGERLVGYVGRLAPEKELERLAEIADVPGTRLVIVGGGPARESVGALLTEAVAAATGRPNLPPVFLGRVRAKTWRAPPRSTSSSTREPTRRSVRRSRRRGHRSARRRPARGWADRPRHGRRQRPPLRPRRPGVAPPMPYAAHSSSHFHLAELGLRGLERVSDRSWASVVGRLIEHYEEVARSRTLVAA